MKTPAGNECTHFFGDYYRGREREECDLLAGEWKPVLCRTCPVPSIERANACEHMELILKVKKQITSGFKPRVQVRTTCSQTGRSGFNAHTGCGECHPIPPVFTVKGGD